MHVPRDEGLQSREGLQQQTGTGPLWFSVQTTLSGSAGQAFPRGGAGGEEAGW